MFHVLATSKSFLSAPRWGLLSPRAAPCCCIPGDPLGQVWGPCTAEGSPEGTETLGCCWCRERSLGWVKNSWIWEGAARGAKSWPLSSPVPSVAGIGVLVGTKHPQSPDPGRMRCFGKVQPRCCSAGNTSKAERSWLTPNFSPLLSHPAPFPSNSASLAALNPRIWERKGDGCPKFPDYTDGPGE